MRFLVALVLLLVVAACGGGLLVVDCDAAAPSLDAGVAYPCQPADAGADG